MKNVRSCVGGYRPSSVLVLCWAVCEGVLKKKGSEQLMMCKKNTDHRRICTRSDPANKDTAEECHTADGDEPSSDDRRVVSRARASRTTAESETGALRSIERAHEGERDVDGQQMGRAERDRRDRCCAITAGAAFVGSRSCA
jgi:hypothetical protein